MISLGGAPVTNYEKWGEIDLLKDHRSASPIFLLSLALLFLPILLGLWGHPISCFWSGGLLPPLLTLPLILLYFLLHELVHGLLIWLCSGLPPRFGIAPGCLYAASDAYFSRPQYLLIALSPVLSWGGLLLVLCQLLPPDWLWPLQLIQAFNFSGSAGDLYLAWMVQAKLPSEIFIQDSGPFMTFYLKKEAPSDVDQPAL